MGQVLVALDVGTSAVKGLAFSEDGEVILQDRVAYTLSSLPGDRVEQDAKQLLEGVRHVLSSLCRGLSERSHHVLALCLSGTMHTLLATDQHGEPLTPVMTWADNRARSDAQDLSRLFGTSLYARTGVPTHAMLPVCKLRWLAREQPALWEQAAHFCSFKEWMTWNLTGTWVVDEATAAASGLWNLHSRTWDAGLLAQIAVGPERLSAIVPTDHVLSVSGSFAHRCGLPASALIVVGATDGVLANLGTVGLDGDWLAMSVGTSCAVRRGVREPVLDATARSFCYPLDSGHWISGGASNSGAMVWSRVAQWLGLGEGPGPGAGHEETGLVEALFALADGASPGSDGLQFLPYLAGERAPLYDDGATGAWVRLTLTHGRAQLARASIEGVAYVLRWIATALPSDVKGVVLSGGVANAPLWRQTVADVFDLPVVRSSVPESVCYGAWRLGARALGVLSAAEFGIAPLRQEEPVYPSPLMRRVHDERFAEFVELTSMARGTGNR